MFLVLTSFTVIPGLIIAGYCWQIAGAKPGTPAPPMRDYINLLTDGVRFVATAVLASSILGAILFTGLMLFRALIYGHLLFELARDGALLTLFLATMVALLGALYVVPGAIVTAARRDSVLQGCHPSNLRRLVSIWYFLLWTLAASAFVGGSLLSTIIGFIPVVGVFIGAATSFYTTVAVFAIFARGISSQ